MTPAIAYVKARRLARGWIAQHDAPQAIERPCAAVLARALTMHGEEKVCAATIARICGEQLDKYVNAEIDRSVTQKKPAAKA